MEQAFFSDSRGPRPIVITGPAGVGKSALIAAFALKHRERFPGGHVQIRVDEVEADDRAMISLIIESLKLARSVEDDDEALRERLQSIPTLIQIDGIDTLTTVPIGRLSKRLRGCFVVWSGRFDRLRIGMDDQAIRLAPLDNASAHELLSLVHAPATNEAEKQVRQTLITSAHRLPLLLRMIAGFLRAGRDASTLVSSLSTAAGDEGKPPSSGNQIRKTLAVLVELGLERIREAFGVDQPWAVDALRQLGHIPPSGVGKNLGAATLGITEDEFERLMRNAEQVGLVVSVPSMEPDGAERWQMHPMIAEILRKDEDRDTVISRMTNWFVEKLSKRETYADVDTEQNVLVWWLEELPEQDWHRVAEEAQYYVRHSRVPMAWFMFGGRALKREEELGQRFPVMHILAQVMVRVGEIAEATTISDGLVGLAIKTGENRAQIDAWLLAAEVREKKGQTLESARILDENVLPRLEDFSEKAAVLNRLCSLLETDGDLDGALTIREKLAQYLGEIKNRHEYAVMQACIARIYLLKKRYDDARHLLNAALPVLEEFRDSSNLSSAWKILGDVEVYAGSTDAALTIYYDRVLPTLKKQRDRHGEAIVYGAIATALERKRKYLEALLMRRERVIPILEQFGDERSVAHEKFSIAESLEAQGEFEKALELYLHDVAPAYEKFRREEDLGKVKYLVAHLYLKTDRPELARQIVVDDLLPYFEKTKDEHHLAVAYSILADAICHLGDPVKSVDIIEEHVWPVMERLGTPQEQATLLYNWGVSAADAGQYEQSLDVFNRAMELHDAHELPGSWVVRQHLGRTLRRRNRVNDLAEARVQIALALDEAEKANHPNRETLRRLLQNPVLERIEIKNFKGIRDLAIDFTHPSELGGQWTCIFGINGAGKSSILQAIALVLLGDENARDARIDQLKRMCRRDGDQVHDAEIHATVRIAEEQRKLSLYISKERGIHDDPYRAQWEEFDKMRAFWRQRTKDHVLLAYGPGRNLSEQSNAKRDESEYLRQVTLFDPLAHIASAEALLREETHVKRIYPLLRQLLTRILHENETGITLDPDRTALRFKIGNARLEPTDLPDGFRATIAWLADLCATWVEKSPDAAKENVPSAIRGIVLLDEIDLHLYPELQRVLVPRLRLALPEVQWIVTTHSPLVLSAFDKSEIKPIRWNGDQGVGLGEPLDRQILGYTADEVYEHVMGVKPRSEALDVNFGDSPDDKARKNLILAQSPSTSEKEAIENRDYRRKLLEQRRQQANDEKKAANS